MDLNIPEKINSCHSPFISELLFIVFKLVCLLGSLIPSAFLLWIMRELPPPKKIQRQEESRAIAFISHGAADANPQGWTAATRSKNQVSCLLPSEVSILSFWSFVLDLLLVNVKSKTCTCRVMNGSKPEVTLPLKISISDLLQEHPNYSNFLDISHKSLSSFFPLPLILDFCYFLA